MKTTSKILSTLLIVVIMATMLVPVVFATSTIGSTPTTGSLSVFKYETSNEETFLSLEDRNTGEQISHIPNEFKPYEGVTFKAIKIEELTRYYKYNRTTTLPDLYYAYARISMMEANQPELVNNTYTQTTDGSGYAYFQNLPLGIYLVQETSAPNQTVEKVEDFIVSIPMTDAGGDDWNYNVYVYPKNLTKYSSITVHKKGLNNTALSGAVFNLQAQLNGSSTWTTLETLTTDEDGNATSKKPLPINTNYRLVETTAPTGYILDHDHDTTTFYIDETGDAVKSSSDSTLMDGNDENTITVTNTKPTIEKYIDKSRGSNTNLITETTFGYDGEHSNTGLDQYFYYTFKVTTPDVDMTSMSRFSISDYVVNNYYGPPLLLHSVTKVSDGSAISSDQYTFSNNSGHMTFSFKTGTGSTIEKNTTYYVTVKSLFYQQTGTTVNNTATLTYSTDTTDNTQTYSIESNQTKLYYGGYQFLKVNNENTPLAGAKFKIYASQADAIAGTNPLTCYINNTSRSTNTTFTSDSNGYVFIGGLYYGDNIDSDSKKYWIVETKAPAGYNLMKDPIEITVNKTSHQYDNSASNSGVNTGSAMEVINTPKSLLPITGGQGTLYIIIISGLLIVIGVVTLIIVNSKRKRKTIE